MAFRVANIVSALSSTVKISAHVTVLLEDVLGATHAQQSFPVELKDGLLFKPGGENRGKRFKAKFSQSVILSNVLIADTKELGQRSINYPPQCLVRTDH
jgi:hypothetical protein